MNGLLMMDLTSVLVEIIKLQYSTHANIKESWLNVNQKFAEYVLNSLRLIKILIPID